MIAIFFLAQLNVCGQSFLDSTFLAPDRTFISSGSSLDFSSNHLIANADSIKFKFISSSASQNDEFVFMEQAMTWNDLEFAHGHLSSIPTTPDYSEIDFLGLKSWEQPDSVVTLSTVLFENVLGEQWISIFGDYRSQHDVLCLTIEEADFFSDSLGIMVPGINYVNKERSGNYHLRGKKSARKAYMHYFKGDSLHFAMNLKVRVHGSMQRGAMQKSLRLYFPGKNKSNDFFPESSREFFDQVILRNGNSAGNGTHITDAFIHAQASNDNLICNPARPVELFINGEYWGFYHLRHRNNKSNIMSILDSEDGVKVFDEKVLTEATYNSPVDSLAKELDGMDLSTPEDWSRMSELVDIPNFIDYILTNTFFSNQDWIINNVKMYRDPHTEKWCFLLDDMDACMNGGAEVDIFQNIEKAKGVYAEILRKVLSCPSFVDGMIERYDELRGGPWSSVELKSEYLKWQSDREVLVEAHRSRWKPSFIHEKLEESQRNAVQFLSHRHYFFEKQLSRYSSNPPNEESNTWLLILGFSLVLGLISIFLRMAVPLRNMLLISAQWLATLSAVRLFCPEGFNFSLFVLPESFLRPNSLIAELAIYPSSIGSLDFVYSLALVALLCMSILAILLSQLKASLFEVCFVGFLAPLYFILMPSADWILLAMSVLLILAYRRQHKLGIALILLASGFVLPSSILILPAVLLVEMTSPNQIGKSLANFGLFALASCTGVGLNQLFGSNDSVAGIFPFTPELSLPSFPLMEGANPSAILLDSTGIALGIVCLILSVRFLVKRSRNGARLSQDLVLSAGVLGSVFAYAFLFGELAMVKRLVLSSGFVVVLLVHYRSKLGGKGTLFMFLTFALIFLLFGSYAHIMIQIKFTVLALFLGSMFFTNHGNKLVRTTFQVLQLCGIAFAQWYFVMQWCCNGPIQ